MTDLAMHCAILASLLAPGAWSADGWAVCHAVGKPPLSIRYRAHVEHVHHPRPVAYSRPLQIRIPPGPLPCTRGTT